MKSDHLRTFLFLPIFFVVLLYHIACAQVSVVVCIPGNSNTQSIQQAVESVFGAGKAMAFGRIRDLENALLTSSPACIIVPGTIIEFSKGYSVILRGKKGAEFAQPYYIVTADSSMTKENFAEKRLAIVDFLGRETMGTFLKQYFNLTTTKLKRANKNEDLLSMIGMQMVDGLILSAAELKEIRSESKLSIRIVTQSSRNVAYPVVALKEGLSADTYISDIQKIPASTLQDLGINGWEK